MSKLDVSKLYNGAKVRCIREDNHDKSLTIGRVYTVTEDSYSGGEIGYSIKDSSFSGFWFITERTEHLFENA